MEEFVSALAEFNPRRGILVICEMRLLLFIIVLLVFRTPLWGKKKAVSSAFAVDIQFYKL